MTAISDYNNIDQIVVLAISNMFGKTAPSIRKTWSKRNNSVLKVKLAETLWGGGLA